MMDKNTEFFKSTACREAKISLRKHFGIWRRKTIERKEKLSSATVRIDQRDKLDKLVKSLKQQRKDIKRSETNSPKNEDCHSEGIPISNFPLAKINEPNSYKNRYQAQKSAVSRLTQQLEEKNRLIEDLKLGIFNQEAIRSLENCKVDIHKIFANCSAKVRCKVAPPPDYTEHFMVASQKAPKMIQEMEEKAIERAKRCALILERKRHLELERKKILERAIENKRIQDEMEKKKNLELMQERRKKELEKQKIRQANKQVFLEKFDKARKFHDNLLLIKGLNAIYRNYQSNKKNYAMSVMHYDRKILKRVLDKWQDFIEVQYADKYQLADDNFRRKALARAFSNWIEMHLNCVRSMQVAEDYYDYRLQKNVFIFWHRYVCKEYVRRDKLTKTAVSHYNRRLLFHYFYMWRTLPAVVQLEKAKELKKRRWREKVWEILPDYKPPQDD